MLSLLESGWLVLLLSGLVIIGSSLLLLCASRASSENYFPATSHPTDHLIVTGYVPTYPPRILTDVASGSANVIGNTLQANFSLEPPSCYTRPNGGYNCIGYITNDAASAYSDVQLEFQAWDRSQNLIYTTTTAPAQQRIMPEQNMPYRVLLPSIVGQIEYTRIRIRDAVPVRLSRSNAITTSDVQGRLTPFGQYHLQATLHNRTASDVNIIRVIVMLEDDNHRFVGYRIREFPNGLAADAELTVDLHITPLIEATALIHHLSIETE